MYYSSVISGKYPEAGVLYRAYSLAIEMYEILNIQMVQFFVVQIAHIRTLPFENCFSK